MATEMAAALLTSVVKGMQCKTHLLEELSVLSLVDGGELGSNQLHVVLVQDPLLQV